MVLGFTGHRDTKVVCPYQNLLAIAVLYPESTWVHGGAKGFDEQVDRVARFFGKNTKDQLIVLKPNYQEFPPHKAPKERNKDIVYLSDIIFAYYDGREKGGTKHCMNWALLQGKPVVNIYSLSELIWQSDRDFHKWERENYGD